MAKSQEHLVGLKCTVCKKPVVAYYTRRNKKSVESKHEFKKFCKKCKQHTVHKEVKA